jgi:hypothetical protein
MQGVRVSRTPAGARFGENTGKFKIAWGFYSSVQKLAIWRGHPIIIYSGGTPWESLQLYWSVFNGDHWSLPRVDIGDCSRAAGSFDVVTDNRNNFIVAWLTFPGRQHIRVRRADASGKWDEKATELDGEERYTRPQLVTDGQKTWVLWGRRLKEELVITPIADDGPKKPTVLKSELATVRLICPGHIATGANQVPLVWKTPTGRRTPSPELYFTTLTLPKD